MFSPAEGSARALLLLQDLDGRGVRGLVRVCLGQRRVELDGLVQISASHGIHRFALVRDLALGQLFFRRFLDLGRIFWGWGGAEDGVDGGATVGTALAVGGAEALGAADADASKALADACAAAYSAASRLRRAVKSTCAMSATIISGIKKNSTRRTGDASRHAVSIFTLMSSTGEPLGPGGAPCGAAPGGTAPGPTPPGVCCHWGCPWPPGINPAAYALAGPMAGTVGSGGCT